MKLSPRQKRLVKSLNDYLKSNFIYNGVMLRSFDNTATVQQIKNGTIVLSIKRGILKHEFDPGNYGGIDIWIYKIHMNGYIRKATRVYGGIDRNLMRPEFRWACRYGIHSSQPARWGKRIDKLIPMRGLEDYDRALLFISNDMKRTWKRLVTLRNKE